MQYYNLYEGETGIDFILLFDIDKEWLEKLAYVYKKGFIGYK